MLVSLLKTYGLPMSVAVDLFRYAFPQNSKMGDFNVVLRQHGVEDVTHVRQKLLKNGYIIKNCKLFIYDAFLNGRGSPKKFKIDLEDVPVLRRVVKDLSKELALYKKQNFPSWDLDQFDKYMSDMLCSSHMKTYVGKFITKKKTFLIKYFGVSRDSIQSDFMMMAVYALYRAFPCYQSPLHFQNIAKTAIHNTGMNLIKFHTRDSRHQMIKLAEGKNILRLTSLSNIRTDFPQEANDPDYRIALDQISVRLPMKAQTLLSLLRGSPNGGFSRHLGLPNETAIDEMDFDTYKQRCCEFMHIKVATADKFLTQLRKHL